MAVAIGVSPTTAAGVSSALVCDGIAAVTVGLYNKDSTLRVGERVGASLLIETAGGTTPHLDEAGSPVVLTEAEPQYIITEAGTYYVDKSASSSAIGVWYY